MATDADDPYSEFAMRLMHSVRDEAVTAMLSLNTGGGFSEPSQAWQRITADPIAKRAVAAAIPYVVDEVLFRLLLAMDNGHLPLTLSLPVYPAEDLAGAVSEWAEAYSKYEPTS
jgi:hypothetical protein